LKQDQTILGASVNEPLFSASRRNNPANVAACVIISLHNVFLFALFTLLRTAIHPSLSILEHSHPSSSNSTTLCKQNFVWITSKLDYNTATSPSREVLILLFHLRLLTEVKVYTHFLVLEVQRKHGRSQGFSV